MGIAAVSRRQIPIIALACMPVISHIIIVETGGVRLRIAPHVAPLFRLGFVTASAMMHWMIYSALFLSFALTLRPGREPMICAMARRMQGPLSAEVATYTKKVTIFWTGFFAAQLVISVLLFFAAPLVVWSFFVNILDLPLVALMFAGEDAVRLRCLRDPPRHSISMIVKLIGDIKKTPAAQP
ncbi:MAG: hypothetical protein POH28_07620 [Acidocella sp.]|nr:hypothetical protein [Acidocella sp.]